MKTSWVKIGLLVLCCAAVAFEVWHFRSTAGQGRQLLRPTPRNGEPDFTLLPASEIPAAVGYFIRPKPAADSWEPTLGDIEDVEANLPQISTLTKLDPNPGTRIDDPRQYFRQYLAVVVKGKKMILLNAFCSNQERKNDWRKHLVFVLDGGKCFWHATYDPAAARFSDLKVNGVA
jgi:hypothetical protein